MAVEIGGFKLSSDHLAGLAAGSLAGLAAGVGVYLVLSRGKGGDGEVRSVTNSGSSGSAVYESARAVDEYLQFHYASSNELAPLVGPFVSREALDFPAACARECNIAKTKGRVLDIGCATGRHAFEMAKEFDEVVAFDFSSAFVEACKKMQRDGKADYKCTVEGQIMDTRTAVVPSGVDRSKIKFMVGDACNMLDLKFGTFDAVLAANLMCRVPDPFKFLRDMHVVVKPGGIFVLVSPYSWLKEYTTQKNWVGGYNGSSGPVFTKDEVKKALNGGFDLISEKNMPFLIREHQRKYQIGCSHCMIFRRKATGKVVA